MTVPSAWLAKAHENLRAAAVLLEHQFPEIAASRIYYAMFYTAEALLLAYLGQAYSSHAAVIAAYGRAFAKTQKLDPRFHRQLIDAEQLRHTGDYNINEGITRAEVEMAWQNAQDFLVAAEAYIVAHQPPT